MACTACGSEVREGARFCEQCGAVLEVVDPTAPPQSVGDGRYELHARLGEGARKIVYRGTDTRLGRDVAIALVKTEGLDANGRARVQREAQAMARLGDHPHVVAVLDVGEQDGQPFIVSQLLTGGSLEDRLAEADEPALPIGAVLRIGAELADALANAHAMDVVHRDVKPANVWFDAHDKALLGDFGLAHVAEETRLTTEGMIVGTASYLAPEVAVGGTADARSDLYALGAVLYEIATGAPPFTGDLTEVVSQHINTPPIDPAFRNAAVPADLDRLVRDLLAKDPDDRPTSAEQVAARLRSISPDAPAPPEERTTPATPTPRDSRFVGRETQLATLRKALEEMLSGRSRLVLVAGEPGVGKTATVEQLAAEARVRGADVLWGRSYDGEIGAPYLAFVECLRTLVRSEDDDDLRAELGGAAPEIATLVSEVREKFTDLPVLPKLEGGAERLRLFDAVVTFLRTAAARRPLLLVLDDLHWADETTLLLLQYLVRNLDRDRILLVGTYRDMELDRTHPLSETIAALRRDARFDRVLLRGMDRDEVGELIASASGQPPPDDFIDAVHEVSEGNPFFVAEILRNLVESGAIREEDGHYVGEPGAVLANLPEGVREVVGRRLDRLSDDTNKLLSVGSAMPGGFTLEVAAPVAGFDLDRALDLLDEALDALVLTERSDAPGTYEFNHALIRQALYGELSTPRRVRMHQRIGEALEERFANQIDAHLPELAYHFFQAAPGGNTAKAEDFALRAGDRALDAAAYEEAARYFDMALQVVDLDDESDPRERGEVLLRMLDASFLAGSSDSDVIERTLTDVLDCARTADDTDLFTRAVLKVGFRRYGGSYHRDNTFEGVLLEALDRVGEDDHFTRAELFSSLVRQLFIHDVDTAAGFAQKAMAEAEASGDPGVRSRAMHSASVTLLPGTEEVEYRERLLALAEEADDVEMQFTAGSSLLMSCLHAGRRRELDGAVEKLRVATGRLRSLRFEAAFGSFEAMVLAVDGRFADAEAQLLGMLDLGRRMDSELVIANTGIGLYQVYRELGRLGELLGPTRRAAAGPEALASWRAGLIGLLTEVGSNDEAAELLSDFDLTTIPDDVVRVYTLCALAEPAARVRDTAMATRLRPLLEGHGGTHVSIAGIAYWGAADRYLGLLDHALGDFDAAVDRHRGALAQHEAFRAPSWVARSQLDLARSLIDRGHDADRPEARRLLDASLTTAQSLGASRLVEEALTEKLAMQGLAGSDPGTSIDLVAAAAAADSDDLTGSASEDGRITVAFSDIEGYTVLTERVGDERSQEILHAHNEVIRNALATHGGTEVKSQGDGFMVVFDRPAEAVRWASDVHRQMAERDFGGDVDALRVRIGMHEGAVITEDEDFYGRTVILAARVGARAAGGTTLVTDHVRTLLDGQVGSFGSPLDVELKGLSGTHRLHPVAD